MIYWVWLSQIPFVGPVTVKRLLTELGSPEAIYCANMEQLHSISGISYKQRESIISHRSLELPEKILKECNKKEIGILCLDDPRYPDRAKIPEDAPAVLYFKGCFKEMEKTVGIVGARRCCQEAKRRAVSLAEEYSGNGYTVISGMAKRIDSYAHTACLNLGGFTVAVAGNGLDICYPSEHKKLMECIEERGLLISEYPPGTRPSRYSFPRRNRIISAWSDKIIAVAPGKGSGALSTIEFGKKYGREVEII